VDGSDNVMFGADYWGSITFGSVTLTGYGLYDIALVKLSGSTGATMWATGLGGTAMDWIYGWVIDRSGDVVVSGSEGGNPFFAKYSGTNGSNQWTKVFVGGGTGYGVTTDPNSGNIYLTGGFSGSVDFGGGAISTLFNGGLFIASYGPSGNYLWAKGFGGSGDAGQSVVLDGNGNVAITGVCNSGADFTGTGIYTTGGGFFVASFTASSSFRWVQRTHASGCGNGIAADRLGHLTTCGYWGGTADFGGITVSGAVLGGNAPFVTQYAQ